MIIGRERLRQILHARGISFHRTRTWKESTDPDRDAKLDRIEYVTSHYPDRCFAFDQFGPLSIRPCHGTCWAPRKHPVRLRATYHRTHGIRYFHGCCSLADDQLWGVTREHKGAGHTLAALKSIRAARPGGYRLFVILDNLSANKTPAIRRWASMTEPVNVRGHRTSHVVAQRRHWFASAAGSRPPFRALVRSASGCRGPGAALFLDDGDRLPLGEPGAGGVSLIELAWA